MSRVAWRLAPHSKHFPRNNTKSGTVPPPERTAGSLSLRGGGVLGLCSHTAGGAHPRSAVSAVLELTEENCLCYWRAPKECHLLQ
ncbi:hypothetical protein NDU88_000429 [Pleurodeles waltl]|uniref:Uncharacterized protein n=1 Tax=Pleurodeles waltl TaxID=8319 RepID=A0AAV7S852_PLEWA|nr:hypothetical protein NDU88_000429 [Pleurodeles waltl]